MGYYDDERCHDRDDRYTSKGQGVLNTVLGVAGTVGALNNGGEGGLPFFNGGSKVAELRAENAELKAKAYAETTTQALYNKTVAENKELSGFLCGLQSRVATLEGQIETDKAKAEVERLKGQLETERAFNAYKLDTTRRLDALEASVPMVRDQLMNAICAEREKRECADNSIVTYLNATFYPKQVADVTVGTTTTAQSVYNPLPCQCRKCA